MWSLRSVERPGTSEPPVDLAVPRDRAGSTEEGVTSSLGALRWSTIVWCEISSMAVVLTGDVQPWLALAVLILIPILGFAEERSLRLAPARTASSVLAIVYLLFFPLDWFFLSERLIFAVVHLMFYLKLHTLLHLRSERDRNRLYVLCLFEMLAAASMTVSEVFVFPLVLFVFCGSLVLLLDQTLLRSRSRVDGNVWRPALRTAAAFGVAILILAAGVFVLLPRTTYGGFHLGGLQGIATTGLTDEIELGDFGVIKRSRDVVMRVVASQQGRTPERWRGAAYDTYRGGRWLQTLKGMALVPRQGQRFLLHSPSTAARFESEVFLEPLDTDVIFLPPAALELSAAAAYLFVDPYLTIRTGRSARAGRRYTVRWQSDAESTAPSITGVEPLEEWRRRRFLQLPPLSAEFHRLADRVVPSAGTIQERAAAVERYLRERYAYSLRTPAERREDPIEDFLFDARAGHCEYFATAMVLMLRSHGITSRLVTGFLRGEPNEVGDFEVVRKLDAHAWVEVFDEQRGWMVFDPTPTAPRAEAEGPPGIFTQGIDSLRMFWEVYVVAFDYERQRGVLGWAGWGMESVISMGGKGWRFVRDQSKLMAGIGIGLAALVALAGTRLGRRWRWKMVWRWPRALSGRRRQRESSSVDFYERVLVGLERSGFAKPASVTPGEYARSLEPQLPGLLELTDLYYRVRFGGVSLEPAQRTRAERLVTSIQLSALTTAEHPNEYAR